MQADIDRILLTRDQIARRIAAMGQEIERDLAGAGEDGEVVLVPILTGAIIFVADLMRHLSLKMRIDVVAISSYPGKSTTSQGAQIASVIPEGIENKHVLIVDDVLDSGGTIRLIRQAIEQKNPASLRACVLLRKQIPSALETPCEYVGFDIPNEFVVGYGLDYDHYYRNLPDIGTLKEAAL